MSSEPRIFNSPYLKRSKVLLIFYGLWPYQSALLKRLKCSILSITTMSLIVAMFQGLRDDTSTDTVVFFETIVAAVFLSGGLLQCVYLYVAHENELRNLCDQIDANWRQLTDAKERSILLNFARQGKALVTFFSVSTVSLYFMFMIFTNIPVILGDASINASKAFPYYWKRMIIDDRFRNLQVFLHTILVSFYSGVVYLVLITTYIYSIKHFCGIYAIMAYRLKKLTSAESPTPLNKLNYDIVPELLDIITKHKNAIKGVRSIGKIFCASFVCTEVCFLSSFAMILFDLHHNLFNPRLLCRVAVIALMFLLHMFYINYGGEMIIKFSEDIRLEAYFMQWYEIPIEARKILLMILRRCQRPETLGWINVNFSSENFVKMLKTSWSVAAVLNAIHTK